MPANSATRSSPLLVFLGGLMLCTPAFANGFPFLYADTGTYLVGGFLGEVSSVRPITYGLWMRHISLMESLWLVVLAQGWVVSWLVQVFFRCFLPGHARLLPTAVITFLALMTHVGITTGMLMPDIFTPIWMLALVVLLFADRPGRLTLAGCGLLFWLGQAMHYSNAYIFLAVLVGGGLLWLVGWWRGWGWWRLRAGRVGLVVLLWAIGYLTIPTLHYAYSGNFFHSKSGHVFLVSRLNQTGLLKLFLEENCATGNYDLCAYKDNLPEDFLWGADSPLNKAASWEAVAPDYNRLLHDFFRRPYYVKKFAVRSMENTLVQFFNFEGRIIFPEKEAGAATGQLLRFMPGYAFAIHASLQYQGLWRNAVTDWLSSLLFLASGLFILYFFFSAHTLGRRDLPAKIGLTFLLALLANAAVCSTVSMVDCRFQMRVVWLLPLYASWLAFAYSTWGLPGWAFRQPGPPERPGAS